MPRRRSRSGRKNSADNKDVIKSSKIDKEDILTTGNSNAAQHSSVEETASSVDEVVLQNAEHLNSNSGSKETTNSRSKLNESTFSTNNKKHSDTNDSAGDKKCLTRNNNKVRPENTQRDDTRRSKQSPRSAKARKGFDNRKQKSDKSPDGLVPCTHEEKIEEECIPSSQKEYSARSLFPTNEKLESEILHAKNIGNVNEILGKSHNYDDESSGSHLNQNKHLNELKMCSPVDVPPEGTDDASKNNSTQEDAESTRSIRHREAKSKDRGDQSSAKNVNAKNECCKSPNIESENEETQPDVNCKAGQNISELEDVVKDLNDDDESSLTICEANLGKNSVNKVSVYEIKRRFSCPTGKSNESYKPKTASACLESEDGIADECGRSKDRANSSGMFGFCTTELYVASVGGKESSSASFLSAVESSSSISADEKNAKFKRMSFHSGLVSELEKCEDNSEEIETEYKSSNTNKVSVKQLKERLISSCSDILDKAAEAKRSAEMNIEKTNSFDENSNKYEKEDFNVSVKERLETYKCQASKAYHNIQSQYNEQELPPGTSIKELQSSFNKLNILPNPVNNINRSKVKNINEDLAQMQSFSMKCKSCGKQVFFMERIMAENSMWHKQCFRCKECQKQLTVENYKSQDGELYCQAHYMNTLKPKPTDETLSESSVVEDIKIPPLNLKPLFEKSQSESSNSPLFSPAPIERSPKFLKRLAKFEGQYQRESEDEEDDVETTSEGSQNSSLEKKTKPDDLETYLQEECRKKSRSKTRKKSSSNGSQKSSTLQVHLKQFFEKSSDENEQTTKKCLEETALGNKYIGDCLQTNDPAKKYTQCIKTEDNVGDEHMKMSWTVSEDTDKKSEDHERMDGSPRNIEDGHLNKGHAIPGRILEEYRINGNENTFKDGREPTFHSVLQGTREKSGELRSKGAQFRDSNDPGNVWDCETEPKFSAYKVSVSELKARLNSSCSNITKKDQNNETCETCGLERNNSDGCIVKLSKNIMKEDFNVSLKDKLESYKTQASKLFLNIRTAEERKYSRTPIKELQSSFGKGVQPNTITMGGVQKLKSKNIQKSVNNTHDTTKCKSCGNKVFFMERVMAEKALWHKNCFRCKECEKLLSVNNYKSHEGELYCPLHYTQIEKSKLKSEKESGADVQENKTTPLVLKPQLEKTNPHSERCI